MPVWVGIIDHEHRRNSCLTEKHMIVQQARTLFSMEVSRSNPPCSVPDVLDQRSMLLARSRLDQDREITVANHVEHHTETRSSKDGVLPSLDTLGNMTRPHTISPEVRIAEFFAIKQDHCEANLVRKRARERQGQLEDERDAARPVVGARNWTLATPWIGLSLGNVSNVEMRCKHELLGRLGTHMADQLGERNHMASPGIVCIVVDTFDRLRSDTLELSS